MRSYEQEALERANEQQRKQQATEAVKIAKHASKAYAEFEQIQHETYKTIQAAIARMFELALEMAMDRQRLLALLENSPGGPGTLLGDLQREGLDMRPMYVRWPGTGNSGWLAGGAYTPPQLGEFSDVLWRAVAARLEEEWRWTAARAEQQWVRNRTIG